MLNLANRKLNSGLMMIGETLRVMELATYDEPEETQVGFNVIPECAKRSDLNFTKKFVQRL
jgi:hypothetical protein